MLAVTLLGPVAAAVRDRPVRLTGRLGRTALAALALHDGRAVAVDALVDALWGDAPPATAREQVHNQISRLRRGGLGSAVVTLTDAYRLDGATVDVATVQQLREQARGAGEPAAAATLLRRACELWRGEPLGGVGPHLAAAERPGLTALRQSVVEERFDAELAAGRDAELLPELAAAISAHPYSEPLRRIRMLALARAGRPAAALRGYEDARALLQGELGIEPSAELRELADRLRTEQAPRSAPARPVPPARPLPPAQLPAAPRSFVGRQAELAELAGLLRPAEPPAPRVVLVSGMAGIGKTALALRAAAAAAGEFPDGALYVDLGGGDGPGVDPAAVLGSFLRALGLDGPSQPTGLAERSAEFRTRTARHRLLVLLDDAADEAQVEPLLPADPGCATVVTSRSALAGLDADRIALAPVDGPDAKAIVAAFAGRRVLPDGGTLERVVAACGGMPLALRLAGAQLAAAPELTAAELGRQLDGGRALRLAAGTLSVRASLESSVAATGPEARAALGRLARLGQVVEPWVAAAMLGVPLDRGREVVAELARGSLLDPAPAGGSYRFHDLVRAHAAERGRDDAGWAAAYGRAAGWAVALTARAHAAAFPDRTIPGGEAGGEAGSEAGGGAPGDAVSAVEADPTGWVEDRWPVLEQLVRAALAAGDLVTATALVANTADLLQRCELLDESERVAAELARAGAGDPAAGATAALAEAGVWAQRGRHPRVAELAEQVVALGDAIDPRLRLDGLATLGSARTMCGEPAAALGALGAALELARRLGDRRGEYSATFSMAEIHRMATGDLDAALEHTTRALALADAGYDVKDRAMARFSAARVHLARVEPEPAARLAAEALRFCRETGDRVGEAWCLLLSADAATVAGDPAAAVELAGRAIALAGRLSQPDAGAGAEVALARALAALGDLPGARSAVGRARRLHEEYDGPAERRSLEALARELGMPPAAAG